MATRATSCGTSTVALLTPQGDHDGTVGLRELIAISNTDIDRICAQAADFASDDHVDVAVRQQLATLLFDNAEMRKQLNAYTEGILTQTMERLEVKKVEDKGWGLDVGAISLLGKDAPPAPANGASKATGDGFM